MLQTSICRKCVFCIVGGSSRAAFFTSLQDVEGCTRAIERQATLGSGHWRLRVHRARAGWFAPSFADGQRIFRHLDGQHSADDRDARHLIRLGPSAAQPLFYGNTFVAGQSFDYHAKGKQIFIGRLIVFGGLIAVNVVTGVVPILGLVSPIVFLVALPWLMARGLRFSARVTSYRNVRFNFTEQPGAPFKAVVLGGAVATLSLGILAPLASRWFYRYLFNNLRYGDRSFSSDPRVGKIYGAALPPSSSSWSAS